MKAWIARDKYRLLWLYFNEKPRKDDIEWRIRNPCNMTEVNPDLFPSVKWEDEEPTEVEIIIKPKKK